MKGAPWRRLGRSLLGVPGSEGPGEVGGRGGERDGGLGDRKGDKSSSSLADYCCKTAAVYLFRHACAERDRRYTRVGGMIERRSYSKWTPEAERPAACGLDRASFDDLRHAHVHQHLSERAIKPLRWRCAISAEQRGEKAAVVLDRTRR